LSTSGKIRLLLVLLFATLLFTAIIVQSTYTPLNNLNQTAKILEDNLHKKEAYVAGIFNSRASYKQLKDLQNNPDGALKFIQHFTTDKSIWFVSFSDDTLNFWSGIKVIPKKNVDIKEGVSFIQTRNGYFEAIKKSEGNFSAIYFIPIKINYELQNKYLQNKFAKDILEDDNIEIASFTDTNVYGVHSSINNTYLFSVKLKQGMVNNQFFYFQLISWLLTFITLCVLVHSTCKYLMGRGYTLLSLLALAVFIVVARYLNLHYNWPAFIYKLDIFNPIYYTSGDAYPSLGDFCLNILGISWFCAYVYRQRGGLIKGISGKFVGYTILFGCILTVILVAGCLLNLFYGLLLKSKISFDVYNVFNLSRFSMLGLLMVAFSFLIYYLLMETFLSICMKLLIADRVKLIIFISCIFIATGITAYCQQFTLFYILLAIPILLRGYAYRIKNSTITPTTFIFIIFICALISFLQYHNIEGLKESETRMALIQKLEIPEDGAAEYLFKKIESRIISDQVITRYFNNTLQYGALKNRFQKLYFDGYLSKYAYHIYEFNTNGQSLSADKTYSLGVFTDQVLYSSFKVSNYFYRDEFFGFQNYFAILPVIQHTKLLGTLVVKLNAKPLQTSGSFPDLLKDGKIKQDDEFRDYSYAFYYDNKLQSNGGTYGYDIVNTTLKCKLKEFTTASTKSTFPEWYKNLTSYSHLIYKPSDRTLIVISKEENPLFYNITSLTFFFILLLTFSLVIILARLLWLRIKILNISGNSFKWIFKINFDRILYKTRIQFSIIAAVVVTLIFVGFITFLSISTQYNEQQENMIRDKIDHITAAFNENGVYNKYLNDIKEESQVDFDDLANTYSTDLILYNLQGIPLITTQPKIYDEGLQSRRMNARAFILLSKFQKSEVVNPEIIGDLQYKAVYAPLINKGKTVAYLQLPYFSNLADYNAHIASLLNIMINVYALIFIVVGLFAVIIARQITAPLSFIQQHLSKIIYGKKNEPIKWERDDEIGALVKEYNKMISALENNAQKLAQSERESAWREMAKQVAHEIKNPLTPLKLGLQLLEKSWRDKDPKFDAKFERFSKSFVEQIESLSSIASEFSTFAKMPDTHLERIDIFNMLGQAVTIFVLMDNIKITYQPPAAPFFIMADRDQLLRCFNNLLKNAIEAAPHEKTGIIEIHQLITAKSILLSIKDNGSGIPENMREKIFEPNFTTKSSGTGLGLAFVKNSIENAGGKIWFETKPGIGTTFFLSLPATSK
jgi:two-component system nitrogen regulation sensor histidine kinase NtrY